MAFKPLPPLHCFVISQHLKSSRKAYGMTRLWVGLLRNVSDSQQGQISFYSQRHLDCLWGPPSHLIHWASGTLTHRVKWLWCEADHSTKSSDDMKVLPCPIRFCVCSCNFSFNPSFSSYGPDISVFWCTCPAWITSAGVLGKLVSFCRYCCYHCDTEWASWRLVNCFHPLHDMGRICFKILDRDIVPFIVWYL